MSKKVVNKIGFVLNKDLPNINSKKGGHYVYIREYDKKTKKCVVNTITSLEDKRFIAKRQRLYEVRNGNIYSIPKKDITLPLWSGVSANPIKNVDISNIKGIGKVKMKKRHYFFIGKFLGKKKYD
ncbi:MAG: hypothetical protein NC087_01610 [Anaeroplasma bactoclasticum]|nr:hypothetical protein [Anaeroplasma bactoclasticum]